MEDSDNPKVADWSGGYFARFDRLTDARGRFPELHSINVQYLPNQEDDESLLVPDGLGRIHTSGKLTTTHGVVYRFSESHLTEGAREIRLSFFTNTLKGINYSFEGTYLEHPREIRKGPFIMGYVHLEGTLRKFHNGRQVASDKVGLAMYAIL